MTDAELVRLLRSDEHNLVERKSDGVKPQELRQTLCAFANSTAADETAVLFVGVHDRTGEIIGVQNTKSVLQRVAEAAGDCAPPVRYKAREIEVDGRRIVAALVGHSADVPHFSGPAYIREGDRSKRATASQHEELVASRNSTTRQLLDWKAKNHRIMVSAVYKRLGIAELNPQERWGPRACRIESVDAHTVTFHVLDSGVRATESIADVHFHAVDGQPAIQIRPRL